LIICGAGLAAALIALRLSELRPAPRILILEASPQPFGDHTWSFHESDLKPADLAAVSPLIAHRWRGQSVRFSAFERTLSSAYASVTSASVSRTMSRLANITLVANAPVLRVSPDGVVLDDGMSLSAGCVIDARGFEPHAALKLGYQKFFGLEVETTSPHGLSQPIIMDASVDQKDGYRFIYVLPFSPSRLLIEDTRYSDGPELDTQAVASDIATYAEKRGWDIASIVRSEQGVLPIALAYDAGEFWQSRPADVPQAGMRAALFHPTTGYSLPEAVRLANLVVASWPIGSAALAQRIEEHARLRSRHQRFYRLLNRMMFNAAAPEQRHLVLQRFYRLPQPLIERFYAGETTIADMLRILIGKPPVPVMRALGCLSEKKFLNQVR
jgi:lycopene beta-cyclase